MQPGPLTVSEHDAGLIASVTKLLALNAEFNALTSLRNNHSTSTAEDDRAEAAQLTQADEIARLETQIGKTEATGPDGWRAKAAAMMATLDPEPGHAGSAPRPGSDGFLAWSLCRDLLADRDATLVALCDRIVAVDGAIRAAQAPHLLASEPPAGEWEHVTALTTLAATLTAEALALPATTPMGWRAKARLIMMNEAEHEGTVISLVRDLLGVSNAGLAS